MKASSGSFFGYHWVSSSAAYPHPPGLTTHRGTKSGLERALVNSKPPVPNCSQHIRASCRRVPPEPLQGHPGPLTPWHPFRNGN